MPKYIDFDALGVGMCNPDVFENKGYAEGWNSLIKILHDAPAADVEMVRHGHNVKQDYPTLFECSLCGWECFDTVPGDTDTYQYCPNCGAKMDEVSDND